MEASIPFFAYKETRLDLDPSTKGSTVSIRLPSIATPASLSRTTQKRSHTTENSIAEDESAFRHKNLATAASVYYRSYHKFPRAFLWRVLEGGRLLSIRAVDVSKQRNVGDAYLTLRLAFPQPILPTCVALSDSKEHDILSVFVLTEGKTLWTFNLRPDHFRKPSSTENNLSDWCKPYTPNVLGIKKAHRLVSLSAYELLISLHDGSLVRLYRSPGGDGFLWKEQHYNEGGWGHGIRSLISFQGSNSIRYGGHNVELSTATSIASPVTSLDNTPYAFAVSLDHQLRVWNLATSKIAYIGDILHPELELQDDTKKVIDPSQSQLVKVISDGDESALCVTFSPLGAGEFKFWNVRPAMDGNLDLEDLFPDNVLIPQAPSSDIWTLADFAVLLDRESVEKMTLWALWKNNMTYRLHKLEFQTGSVTRVRNAWNGGWEAMSLETLRSTPLPTIVSGDSSDVTDRWLEFILTPSRFSTSTLETGLAIYERGLGSSRDMRKLGSLADRMCTAIASTAALGRTSDGTMEYDQFRIGADIQWRRFYRLLDELDKQRGEAMSLVIDPEGRMPWVVLADGVTAIRDCSGLERIWHNVDNLPTKTERIARPLVAAASFAEVLPENFVKSCKSMLLEELFQEPSVTEVDRMRAFYDKCDFANQVGDEEYLQLRSNLGGNFKKLTLEVYEAILERIDATEAVDRQSEEHPLAEFGNKLVVRGVQEVTELHRNICLQQIILLIFVEVEINHEEDGIGFDTATVFNRLMMMLRRLELVHWLSSTQLSLPLKRTERSGSVVERNSPTKQAAPHMETITVLEGVHRHLFDFDPQQNEAMSSVVTEILLDICATESHYESPPAVTQSFLLKHDRADLAIEFARFAGHDPFSTYIQGRAYLAANDALTASVLFKKAAFGMSYPDPMKRLKYHSASYLDETEKTLMNAGLPEYYSHIVALFDKEKNFSFVMDFARLSLQFIKPTGEVQSSHLRTEMHSRLFNAALHTAQFDTAHSVLLLFTDTALQTSSLRTLITKMCETAHASQLINLPFIGLQDLVDEILLQKCQSIVDVTVGVPYHKILYAWRIKRSDFRGAAAISLDRLQKLQQSGDGDKAAADDTLETPVTKQYISLINALSCVDPKQAWILSEEFTQKGVSAFKPGDVKPNRKVVTLADVRKSYQDELDRLAAIQNNQFAFAGGDEMDVL